MVVGLALVAGFALAAPRLTSAQPGSDVEWPWMAICTTGGLVLVNALTGEQRRPEEQSHGNTACHLLSQRRKGDVARLPA